MWHLLYRGVHSKNFCLEIHIHIWYGISPVTVMARLLCWRLAGLGAFPEKWQSTPSMDGGALVYTSIVAKSPDLLHFTYSIASASLPSLGSELPCLLVLVTWSHSWLHYVLIQRLQLAKWSFVIHTTRFTYNWRSVHRHGLRRENCWTSSNAAKALIILSK